VQPLGLPRNRWQQAVGSGEREHAVLPDTWLSCCGHQYERSFLAIGTGTDKWVRLRPILARSAAALLAWP
jgi:hypothetical protein